MPAPSLGLINAGASNALHQLLARRVAAQVAAEQEQYQRALDDRKLSETERRNLRTEGQDDTRIGLEGQRVGFEGERVGIAKAAEGRASDEHGWKSTDRAGMLRTIQGLTDPAAQSSATMRLGGVTMAPDDLRTPEQVGTREGAKGLATWIGGAQDVFKGQEGIRTENQRGTMRLGGDIARQNQQPNYVWVTKPDGSEERVIDRPGLVSSPTNRSQGRPVISGDAGNIADFETALDDLDALEAAITETSGATGTAAKVGASLPNWVTDLTGWGTDAKKRQGVIDRVKQVIGKTLEGGVLRKEDEYKYTKILPTIADAPDVAKSKLIGLREAITQRNNTFLDSLSDAGYDVSRYRARGGQREAPASKTVTESELRAFAQSIGKTFEEEKTRATAAGFVIIR